MNLSGTPYIYADDIALVYSSNNTESLVQNINTDMDRLYKWFTRHHLTLNVNKTKYMILSSTAQTFDIWYNGERIEPVKTFRYLGIVIDDGLTWKPHIQYLMKKISPIAGLFRKISLVCPKYILKSIYHSLFESHLIYGLVIWSSTYKSTYKHLQTLQNRAIKNLYKYKRNKCTKTIYIKHNLLPLNELIQIAQTTQLHNIINRFTHTNTTLQFGSSIHAHNTRFNNHIHQPSTRTTRMGTYAIQHNAISTYNALPDNLKRLNKTMFKKYTKDYYKQVYINVNSPNRNNTKKLLKLYNYTFFKKIFFV